MQVYDANGHLTEEFSRHPLILEHRDLLKRVFTELADCDVRALGSALGWEVSIAEVRTLGTRRRTRGQ